MPTHPEATRLNLEYYRKAAKALLKAAQSGDASAVERIARYFPGAAPALHHAQLTIAREQGFASWPRFRAFLVESSLDSHGLVAEFIDAALGDARRARVMLTRHHEIERAGLYPALVLGDVSRVEKALAEMPDLATRKGGPREWAPLLYVGFSRLGSGDPAGTARLLLTHGADPNASYTDERWPAWPLSCLYAATGLNNNPELARALLDAGANPDDSESLYHSTEHPGLECLKLLIEYHASPTGTNALKHMLDREEIEGVRLLLAAGADPNQVNSRGETALHWAVWRGRGSEIISVLLDAGADIDARRMDGLTASALAVQTGQPSIAILLASRGANTEIAPLEPAPLPDLAMNRHVSAVRSQLAAGVPVDTRGEAGGTALHWACWKGYPDLVRMLLDHSASLTIEDHEFHATPCGWLSHGSTNCTDGDGDHPQVARLLLAAGGTFKDGALPTGNEAVDAVFREHGLIT
jgi:ankyrin repeat protein